MNQIRPVTYPLEIIELSTPNPEAFEPGSIAFKTAVTILLNTPFPMFLFWGAGNSLFYNKASNCFNTTDNSFPLMGEAVNKEGCFFWEIFAPLIKIIRLDKQSITKEKVLLLTHQNQKIEETYWDLSLHAIQGDQGQTAGVIVHCFKSNDNEISTINKIEISPLFDRNQSETYSNLASLNDQSKPLFNLTNSDNPAIEIFNKIEFYEKVIVEAAKAKVADNNLIAENGKNFKISNPNSVEQSVYTAKEKVLSNNTLPVNKNGVSLEISRELFYLQALIESENNFRQLVEQAPVAICVLKNADLKIFIANNMILELWQRRASEVMNIPIFTCLPELKENNFEQQVKQVYDTGIKYISLENKWTYQKEENQITVFLNFVFEAIKDANKNIEGVMIVATDVSGQVIARQKIEEAEERTRLAIEGADLGTYDFNIVTNEVISSARARAIIFGKEDMASRNMFGDAIHPADINIRQNAYVNAFASGKLSYRIRVIWHDKSIHWVRIEGQLTFDITNKPIRVLGTVLDITDQQNAEQELMKINQRLDIAMEVGELGSYELNLKTGGIEASKQFRKIFGFNETETILLENVLNKIAPGQEINIKQVIKNAIDNKLISNIEFQIEWKDGSLHWIKSSAKALYTSDYKPYCFIGITSDISDTKLVQKQKDDFIGMVSHELKSPLTSIKGYNQILEEILLKKGNDQEAGMLGKMKIQVNRLTNMIEDLQENTKTNSGNLRLNLENFNLNILLKSVVDDVVNTTPGYNIELDFTETDLIVSDKNRLVQVFTNLLTNAIKYGGKNKVIIVKTIVKNNEIILGVQDFGPGISKSYLPKVFEQFYRILNPATKNVPGLGLGLYISAGIIKQLGGKIWVESEEGKGATFYIALPVLNK